MSSKAHLIIDGYNFILYHNQINSSDEEALFRAREELIHLVRNYTSKRTIQATIVFDGRSDIYQEKAANIARVKIVYSTKPQTADQVILNMLKKNKSANTTLVTNDRQLIEFSKAYRCENWSCAAFQQKASTAQQGHDEFSKKYKVEMSKKELNEWLDLFNKNT